MNVASLMAPQALLTLSTLSPAPYPAPRIAQCAVSLEWLLDSFLGKDHPEVLEKGMTTAQVCVYAQSILLFACFACPNAPFPCHRWRLKL